MQFRRAQAWVWWLLPLMVARAMLPSGFMPTLHDAGLQFTFCSMSVQQQDAPADSKHADLSCPFAHANGAAPIATLPMLVIAQAESAELSAPAAQLEISYGPPRIDRVRGPPKLI